LGNLRYRAVLVGLRTVEKPVFGKHERLAACFSLGAQEEATRGGTAESHPSEQLQKHALLQTSISEAKLLAESDLLHLQEISVSEEILLMFREGGEVWGILQLLGV
jgi:hypothetical protein